METTKHAQAAQLRQDISELDQRWVEAVRAHDEAVLRRLLSGHVTAVFFDGSGAQGQEAVIERLFKLKGALGNLEVARANVQVLGPGAAVMHGRASLEASALLEASAEELSAAPFYFTRIWHQGGERWVLAAPHSSRAA